MNRTVYRSVNDLIGAELPPQLVDSWLDCLSILYQVSVWVEPLKHGVFCFFIKGFSNLEVVRSFLDKRKFLYVLQTSMLHDYEIQVDVFRLIYKLNDLTNYGMRKPFDDTKSSV